MSDWWKYQFLVIENPQFCTSNETIGVEKLADWLIVVVSAHARKLKQLILSLGNRANGVRWELLWGWGLLKGRNCGVLNMADS